MDMRGRGRECTHAHVSVSVSAPDGTGAAVEMEMVAMRLSSSFQEAHRITHVRAPGTLRACTGLACLFFGDTFEASLAA